MCIIFRSLRSPRVSFPPFVFLTNSRLINFKTHIVYVGLCDFVVVLHGCLMSKLDVHYLSQSTKSQGLFSFLCFSHKLSGVGRYLSIFPGNMKCGLVMALYGC